MFRSMVFLISGSLLVVDCSSQAPAPPSVVQATSAPLPSDTLPSPNQKWDTNTVRCQQWIDAADDDRAATGMFYYGWLAGVHNIHEIRPVNIQPNLRKVLDYCGEHHDATIIGAFQATLAPRRGQ